MTTKHLPSAMKLRNSGLCYYCEIKL